MKTLPLYGFALRLRKQGKLCGKLKDCLVAGSLMVNLTIISIFILFCQLVYGQATNILHKRIDVRFRNLSPKEALLVIGGKAGCTFVYSSSDIDPKRLLSADFSNETVYNILKSLFGDSLSGAQIRNGSQVDLRFAADRGKVKGRVLLDDGNPLSHAAVNIPNIRQTETDIDGNFILSGIPAGRHKIMVSYVGRQAQEKYVTVLAGATVTADFNIDRSVVTLQEIRVVGKSTLQEVKEQAYNVEVLNTRSLHNTSLGLSSALDRVSGVRIRSTGGLGESATFSMNGFAGNHVRFFIDGVPMEVFGSTYQINNIPIEVAERIEVYKGVAPVSLSSDALGGVVNIITTQHKDNYLDASYSFGSFNTHKTFINTGYVSSKGFTASLNAFQNYSDNNYWIDARILNLVDKDGMTAGQYYPGTQRVRRFHDQYHNETLIARIGIIDKSYADQLQIGINLGKEYQDSQTGTQMDFVYGERRRRTQTVTPFLTYSKKDLLFKNLDTRVTANYNLGYYQFIDTAALRYNWLGESAPKSDHGEYAYSSAKHYDRDGSVTLNADYQLTEQHSFSFSHVLTFLNRKGEDPFNYTEESHMLGAPKKSIKNITGLSYKFDYQDFWNTSVFIKKYLQTNEGPHNTTTGAGKSYTMMENEYSNLGYGLASTYFFDKVQVKASYEKTYRLPSTKELFGDESFNAGNMDVKPESSHNYNLNMVYSTFINKENQIEIGGSFLFRKTQDYIIRSVGGTAQRPATFANHGLVHNSGLNGEVKYYYKRLVSVGVNFTWQNLKFKQKYDPGDSGEKISLSYNTRVPNVPYIFGNGFINLNIRNVLKKNNTLNIGYNTLYVHEFPLHTYFEGTQNVAMIPAQFTHNAFISYMFMQKRLVFTIESWNMTDEKVFDEYKMQKPGRSFTAKIGYKLIRNNNRKEI